MRILLLLLMTPAGLTAAPNVIELIRNGDHRGLAVALKAGADANSTDEAGIPALTYAAIYSNVTDLKILLHHGAKVNAVDPSGGTALMASLADIEKVRLLFDNGAEASSGQGTSPLSLAARVPSGDAVTMLLLAKGAKPDATFVRRAAVEGKAKLVEIGLAAGVDAKSISVAGVLDPACLKLLLGRGATTGRDTAVSLHSYYGSVEGVRALLESGAGVNEPDSRQRTAIHYAAGSDFPQPAILKLLIKHGADPKAKDARGDTALDWARFRGDAQMIQMLGGAPKHGEVYHVAHGPLPPVREAVQRAMRLLETAGPEFFKKNACISCHNQSIPQMASGYVRPKEIALDSKVTALQIQAVLGVWSGVRKEMWRSDCRMGGGRVATMTYGVVGLGAEKQPRDQTISLAAHCLTVEQHADGSWQMFDLRAPLGMSTVKHTALGLRGLQLYTLPGRSEEFAERIQRARKFLESVKAATTQDLVFQILGLRWAGAELGVIEPLARELAKLQRKDGGWPQRPELESDAYSTAQAAWALHEGAGRSVNDAVWRRGAEYLRIAQQPDGSWHVHSRGFGFQPYRETGFPHGHDQWISAAATGFAVIALSPLIEDGKVRAGK